MTRSARLLRSVVKLTLLFTLALCAQGQRNYLPLQAGMRWEMRSNSTGSPMVFTVESVSADAAVVNWSNPWTPAKFLFQAVGSHVLLQGLDMGNGVAKMPAGTVYFDFDATEGSRWSNPVGKFKIVSKDLTVQTPAGTFQHCIEITATDSKGGTLFWYLAPDVGFVQFGEGSSAFRLARYGTGTSGKSDAPKGGGRAAVSPGLSTRPLPGRGVLVGLESNPTPQQGFSFAGRRESQAMSAQAGSRLIFVGPKWDELEPSPGHYNFSDVDDRVRLAEETGAAIIFNLRVIDTNRKAVPKAYESLKWDDPAFAAKVTAALQAIAPHLHGRARWVTIGNEVNSYFSTHKGDVPAYARMLSAITPDVNRLFPGVPVTVNFTSDAARELDSTYRSITVQTSVNSINFYPINADFTFRDPDTAARELQDLIRNSSRPIVFQEMGYPSSSRLGSSEAKQAAFVTGVLGVVARNQDKVQAVSFNWRSDLPTSVVNDLTSYYKLGNSANFKEFLASLGWFRQDGTPKRAWSAFQQAAPSLLPR